MSKESTLKPGSRAYAAAKIGCSLPTLYQLIAAGKLRSYHIGRAHRVSEQAILDCISLLERENPPNAARERFGVTRTSTEARPEMRGASERP
jgi:excisionase family DNA binding protein